MQIISGLDRLSEPLAGSIVTIGNFDGVHLGHRELLKKVIEGAKLAGVASVAVTFDPHPALVLRPETPSPRLFSLVDTETEFEKLGLEILVVENFTKSYSQISAEEFVRDRLQKYLRPRVVFVGYDFQFGHDRGGSFSELEKWGKHFGFKVERLAPVLWGGEIVSSSAIRKNLISGAVEVASKLLTRPYSISGTVVRGDGRGEELGFSTANISTQADIIPKSGVYLTYFWENEKSYPSLTNIGVKPTFHEHHAVTIETHVLGGKKWELYGHQVKVEFLKRIRDELKFPSAHALIKQIGQDVDQAKKYFGL